MTNKRDASAKNKKSLESKIPFEAESKRQAKLAERMAEERKSPAWIKFKILWIEFNPERKSALAAKYAARFLKKLDMKTQNEIAAAA